MFVIREPKWKDKTVGLDEAKMVDDILKVEITYTNREGVRLWPKPLYIERSKAMRCPVHLLKDHRVKLRMVPIKDLKEVL